MLVIRALPGELRQRGGKRQYQPDEASAAWDEQLHSLLGAAWPCPETERIAALMADIGTLLAKHGLDSGRYTYAWYSDADTSLCRAAWCVARHTQPDVVVETGVAHGITSRVVLEALELNDAGHLWSIDLPFPFDHRLHVETGVAVTDSLRPRWTYIAGSSRQRMPALVTERRRVDMFIHDSLHTARNTLFEMEQAARTMAVGGVLLVDDIMTHNGFATFARRHPGYQTIVCQSDDQIGMFGIAVRVALIPQQWRYTSTALTRAPQP
jgi:hypothetical protein